MFINEVIFDKSFSFIYSARPGTPASTYTDDVTLQIKKERLALVQKTIDKSTEQISKAPISELARASVIFTLTI
jgi:tRNA-2-methylthio-N6-dimethylallyladenosine synthase